MVPARPILAYDGGCGTCRGWVATTAQERGAQVVTSEHRVVPRLVGGLVRVAQRWVKKNRCDFLLGLVAVLIADHAT